MARIGFDNLKAQLANRPGVTNPGGLAAAIGRKKFGDEAMAKAAATHTALYERRRKRKKS